MTTADRREYGRRYAERRRDAQWAREAMSRTHCHRRLARGLVCGEPLQSRVVDGETVPYCPRCACKRRGICIDCRKAPVVGAVRKGVRCVACKKFEAFAAQRRYQKRHPAKLRAQWKRRKAKMIADGRYARELERKKLWRHANPTKKKQWAAQWIRSEHAREYHRAYNARRAEAHRIRERDRARLARQGVTMTHPCVACGTPLTGRQKKCTPCATAIYRQARAILTGAAA